MDVRPPLDDISASTAETDPKNLHWSWKGYAPKPVWQSYSSAGVLKQELVVLPGG